MIKKIFLLLCLIALPKADLLPLPALYSLRGFEFIEKDILHPMVGRHIYQTLIENLYFLGHDHHPLVRTVKKMFYTHTPLERPRPTCIGFYGNQTSYEFGWLAALSQRKDLKDLIKLAKKCLKTSTYLKNADPLLKYAQHCNHTQNTEVNPGKGVAFRTTVSEVIAQLSDFMLITKKATPIFHPGKNKKTILLELYSPEMPLLIINALATAKAYTKKDILEFIRGFIEHCTEEQKAWFNIKTFNNKTINASTFKNYTYSTKDYEALKKDSFKEPSKWDLFYLYSHKSKPIRMLSIQKGILIKHSIFDCCETGVLRILQLLLATGHHTIYSLNRLPTTLRNYPLIQAFVSRFQDRDINDPILRTQQFLVFANHKDTLLYHTPEYEYGLEASETSILKALNFMLGTAANTFEELGKLLSWDEQTVCFETKKDPKQV